MGNAAGHRVRWTATGLAIVGWFVALAMNVGGNAVHLLLGVALVLVVYELLTVETPG